MKLDFSWWLYLTTGSHKNLEKVAIGSYKLVPTGSRTPLPRKVTMTHKWVAEQWPEPRLSGSYFSSLHGKIWGGAFGLGLGRGLGSGRGQNQLTHSCNCWVTLVPGRPLCPFSTHLISTFASVQIVTHLEPSSPTEEEHREALSVAVLQQFSCPQLLGAAS